MRRALRFVPVFVFLIAAVLTVRVYDTSTTRNSAVAAERPAATSPAVPPTVYWIGDSYPAGYGTTLGAPTGYATLAAQQLGWRLRLDAANGRGFLNTAQGPTFEQTVTRGAADVVVIDGGRNDELGRPADERAAAVDFVDEVAAMYPSAQLVLVVPKVVGFLPGQQITPLLRDAFHDLAEQSTRITVVDPELEGWFPDGGVGYLANTPTRLLHLNDAGAALAAGEFVRHLAPLVTSAAS